jgi:hypothetical protein
MNPVDEFWAALQKKMSKTVDEDMFFMMVDSPVRQGKSFVRVMPKRFHFTQCGELDLSDDEFARRTIMNQMMTQMQPEKKRWWKRKDD